MDETVGQDRRSAADMVEGGDGPDGPAAWERIRLSAEPAGSLSAFATRMDRAASRRPPDRIRELRSSLAAATARAIAADVPPDAIGVLAMAGHHQRATDLAAMVAPESRSDAYYRIAVALKNSGQADAADSAASAAIVAAQWHARESGTHYPLEHLAYSFRKNRTPEWERQTLDALQATGMRASADDYHVAETLANSGDIDGAWEAARRITEPVSRDLAVGKIVAALARDGRFQDAINAAETVEDRSWGLIADIAAIAAEDGDMPRTTEIVGLVPAQHRRWAVTKAGTVLAQAGRVEDAIALTQIIDDATDREYVIRAVASALAQTAQVDSAISVWTTAASGDSKDYFAADMAKTAAGADDIDGALQIAATIDSEYSRKTAVAHAASAAALGGDMRRATALVRVIGSEPGEDGAFAAVAKDLAAAGRFDDAEEAVSLITAARVRAGTLVAVAHALAAAGDYQRSAAVAGAAVQADGGHVGALIAWTRALALSGEPGRAMVAGERAVAAAEEVQDLEEVAEALASWSAALAVSGQEGEALAAAQRAIAAVESEDPHWRSDPQYWRERRAEKVAVILAEAGPAEQALTLARSLAGDHDRDIALTAVAEKLARRGLVDQAIDALRVSAHFSSYRARDDLGKIARILAQGGHGDAALRAAYALAEVDEFRVFVEYDIASLVREVAGILAGNYHVETALLTARKSRPSWNRPAAYMEIACAVALTGDLSRAVEIAKIHAGHGALAKVASILADSGNVQEALPIAERVIRMILTGPPRGPSPAEAIALLEGLASSSAGNNRAAAQSDTASSPVTSAAIAAAVQAAGEADAVADPAEGITAQAGAAVRLALTAGPALMPQAVALAKTVAEHVHEADDGAELAMALGNVARVFSLAGEPRMAAEVASECLAITAASPFEVENDAASSLAIDVLTDIGQVVDALVGLGSLKNEMTQVTVLCGIAKRLADSGRTEELARLVSDHHGLPSITGTHERCLALTGLGRVLADTGQASMADIASDMAADASGLTGELTEAYQRAAVLAGQAGVLAALGRCQEAIEFARQAVEAAKDPIGGWRGQVITEAVEALARCGRITDAAEAAKYAPLDQRAECVIIAASALLEIGQKDEANELVSEELAAVRAAGLRQAFYDLVCGQLPKHPDLFRSWMGDGAEVIQISQELTAIERWWN